MLQADAPPPANNLTCPKILRHIYSNIHSLGGLLSSIVGAASTDCGARNASAVGCLVSRTLRNAKADLHSSEGGPNGCECGPHEQRVQTGPEVGDQNTNPNKQKGSHSQEPHFEATTASVRCRAGSEGRCLAVETDPEEYRVRLLEETWVVLNERAPQFRGGQSEEDDHGWTQTEVQFTSRLCA